MSRAAWHPASPLWPAGSVLAQEGGGHEADPSERRAYLGPSPRRGRRATPTPTHSSCRPDGEPNPVSPSLGNYTSRFLRKPVPTANERALASWVGHLPSAGARARSRVGAQRRGVQSWGCRAGGRGRPGGQRAGEQPGRRRSPASLLSPEPGPSRGATDGPASPALPVGARNPAGCRMASPAAPAAPPRQGRPRRGRAGVCRGPLSPDRAT